MNYYRIVNNDDESAWAITIRQVSENLDDVNVWAFSRCHVYSDTTPVPFSVKCEGRRVDYNSSAFCVTVISCHLATTIKSFAKNDVQLIPATVNGPSVWHILNVLKQIDCIDRNNSVIQYNPPDDARRPNEIRGVLRLVIDESKVQGCHLFKPADWLVADIDSEELKIEIGKQNLTGIDFWKLNP